MYKHSILSKAYLVSPIYVILSSKLHWLAKVSNLQKVYDNLITLYQNTTNLGGSYRQLPYQFN